ncbi:MAG: 4Fe-4S binding protein [Candidatus Hydrogenedentes bacterium]|nr:4Fe-4S binding protein [Candidatus Hydrogenedentota bacterium]
MSIVCTIPEKCKRCYACVRECPAKAIKVEHGQALVIDERCIACGNCVKVCSQNAKQIRSSTDQARRILAAEGRTFACLAPSFPAAFNQVDPGSVIAGIRALGFDDVWMVSFGAELVAREYVKLFERPRNGEPPIIATACPAVVAYVEKHLPSLRNALAPVVSPMIATARAIRYRYGSDVSVIFIGPCIAKKDEICDPYVVGSVNCVLTFKELRDMIVEADIRLDELQPEEPDGPQSRIGGSFPLSGGLLKTAGLMADVLDNDIVVAEGKDRALLALTELQSGRSQARFLDVLFCEGCINGPRMLNSLGVYARKEILADYVNRHKDNRSVAEFEQDLKEFEDVHLGRAFSARNLTLPQPSEAEIVEALREMRKSRPEDQLNCGACGYPTCREKAIAVCQGLAEASMCLPFLIDELEDTCERLQASHVELESAQQRLVQSERLASMGQLSAGVAHELNNPLGTVLIYSHMLLRGIQAEDATRADLEMIVNEATRCKKIVRGLLDFARKSRVSKAPTDLARVLEEVCVLLATRAREENVHLVTDVEEGLPVMNIDGDQVKQMLINLVGNAIDAIDKEDGKVELQVTHTAVDGQVVIRVTDNGRGIAPEDVKKLFTPFFTTKEFGKGTGLGLAIAYGIVKMHSGDITAESEVGKGTTFTVSLPILQEEPVPVA